MIYIALIILLLLIVGYFSEDKKKKEQDNKEDLTLTYFYSEIRSSIQVPTEISWNEKRQKWNVPKGYIHSELDRTFFPPINHQNLKPEKGMIVTIWQDPIKKLAEISGVKNNGKEILVHPEYFSGCISFTLKKGGNYKEKYGSAELYIGIQESNYVEYKQWYSRSMLTNGPIKGTDVRDYLPQNWEENFKQ